MNTAANLPQLAQDYRSEMQGHAMSFLRRHQAEYLTDDGQLFERATQYLVQNLDVPLFMAPRLAHLAMVSLFQTLPHAVTIDHAAGPDLGGVLLIDNRDGRRAYIPGHQLPPGFLAQAVEPR